MATKAKLKKKPRQPKLFKGNYIKEIDSAAEEFDDIKNTRSEYSKQETEANKRLVDLMHKHKRSRYETESELIVDITENSKASTKKKKQPKTDNDN